MLDRLILVSSALVVCALPRTAAATDHGHQVGVTISPFHLASPVVELTAEYAASRNVGVAAIGGYGELTIETSDPSGPRETSTLTVYEAGAQVRYYVIGSFDHGMQLGGEALYVRLDGEDVGNDDVDATGSAFGIGPFLGYKKAARFGLTFDAQLGVQYFAVRAKGKDSSGSSVEEADRQLGLLFNLNLGWSF